MNTELTGGSRHPRTTQSITLDDTAQQVLRESGLERVGSPVDR